MGLENRDYFRDGSYSASLAAWGVDFTPVVKWLIIVNVAVFVLQIFVTRAPEPTDFPGLDANWRDAAKAVHDPEDDEVAPAVPDQKQLEDAARKAREVMEKMMSHLTV